MALEFYWEPTYPYIITTALWIFSYVTLIIWTKNMKKQQPRAKHINFLQIIGIMILVWSIVFFFLPSVRIDFWTFPTELEFFIYNSTYFLSSLIPLILNVLLGIAITLYISHKYLNNRKAILGF